jgi:hypothetical protein
MSNIDFDRNVAFLKRVRDDKTSESYNLPLYNRIQGIGKGNLQPGMSLKELPKEFKKAYSIDELIPLIMKERFRRTILDNLYKDEPGKEKMINDAYENFLANPNKHHPDKDVSSFYYEPDDVAKFNRALQDGDLDPHIIKWEKLLNSTLSEAEADRIFQIMGINPDERAIKEDKNKAIKQLQEVVDSQKRSSSIDSDVSDVLKSLSDKTHAVLAAAAADQVNSMGGSSRKYLRRRFKKSKSKSKSKKSKSKSKTKQKLKSKYKTKYRKQNK